MENAEVIGKVEERTLECSTSPKLYKPVFKQSCEGRDSDTGTVLANNSSDVDLLVLCGSRTELESICWKNRISQFLSPLKQGVSLRCFYESSGSN